jgi:NTE family protein
LLTLTGADVTRLPGRARLRYREGAVREDRLNRPYLHLVDGGVSDNLGLRPLVEALAILEQSKSLRQLTGFDKLQRLAVIIVNSRSDPLTDWSRKESPPGPILQLLKATGVPIDRYSYDQIELLKDMIERWSLLRERARLATLEGRPLTHGEADLPDIEFYPIDISFDEIDDPEQRVYFMNLPTTFALPPEAIDNLRSMAGTLMRKNPAYQKLLRDLGAGPR